MSEDRDKFNEVFGHQNQPVTEKREVRREARREVNQDKNVSSSQIEKDYRPKRSNEKEKSGVMGGFMYLLFIISVSVIIACLGWMAATDVLALNKGEVSAVVKLPDEIFTVTKGDDGKTIKYADMDYVAETLKDNGIIEYKWLFKLYSSFSHANTKLDAGSYELKTTYDYRALVKKMQTGSTAMITAKITIPEGYTMEQIFRLLDENDVCNYYDLMDAAADYTFSYSFLGEDFATGESSRLEGYLFPDTYEFYTGIEASSAIAKLLENFRERMTAEMLEQAKDSGYELSGVIKIASMIEKEAANDDERAIIASVIFNRLKSDMPLGIDATSLYMHQDHEGAPTSEMLADTSDPYNTRLNVGLTPTAICNPGLSSIRAALQPAKTNYYYYALDTETGTHKFFKTVGEFNAFTATQNYN